MNQFGLIFFVVQGYSGCSRGPGGLQQAKRAFVKVLLTIAALCSVRLELSRNSWDEACNKAFNKLSLKVHTDKGGLRTRHHAKHMNL